MNAARRVASSCAVLQVGSVQAPRTLEVIRKNGFPADKRLGAGVIDGRGVWADNGRAAAVLGELKTIVKGSIAVQVCVSLMHDASDLF